MNKPNAGGTIRNYSSPDVSEADKVVMVVRPRNKYGHALAGESVKIDRDELRRPSTAEALYSAEEHQAAQDATIARAAASKAPESHPVRDAIQGALALMWAAAGEKGDAKAEG